MISAARQGAHFDFGAVEFHILLKFFDELAGRGIGTVEDHDQTGLNALPIEYFQVSLNTAE